MASHARISKEERDRIVKLAKQGLSYEAISRRLGRPPRTVGRVVQRSKKEAAETQQA